jgi:hypothetical protein
MSPTYNFDSLVSAAQNFGVAFSRQLENGPIAELAAIASGLGSNFLWGGTYDYQRQGVPGFFYGQYRDVSQFQIGVFTYYSDLPKEVVLQMYGAATRARSSNSSPAGQVYNLPAYIPARNREMFELGYYLSQQGYIGNGQVPARSQSQPDWTRLEYLRVP